MGSPSCIYVIGSEDHDGPVKIGVTTRHVNERMQSLQPNSRVKLSVQHRELVPREMRYRLERAIHRELDDHRLQGEWFKVPLAAAIEVVSKVVADAVAEQAASFYQDPEPSSSWQIRDFPEELRETIIKQAKAERLTVGEFVSGHMGLLRDAGWSESTTAGGQSAASPSIDRIALLTAVTALSAATQRKIPGATTLAAEMIREARGLPPLPPRLTGPKRRTVAHENGEGGSDERRTHAPHP